MAQQRQTSETNKPAATATAQMPAGQAGPAADNAAVARPDPSAPAKAEVAELLRGEVDIDKLTYAQLRALAAELGVDVWDEKGKSLTDIQLREALNRWALMDKPRFVRGLTRCCASGCGAKVIVKKTDRVGTTIIRHVECRGPRKHSYKVTSPMAKS